MRHVPAVTALAVLPAIVPAAAYAAARGPEPTSRADYLAAHLRQDPVYVTDHTPRLLGPSTAVRIKADVARLGEPVYVVVALSGSGDDAPDALVPLLHDRLGKDGLYLFVPPDGEGAAVRQYGDPPRAYGGGLSLDEIMLTAEEETPYDRNAEQLVRRFVDVALAPDARAQYEHPHRPPEPREDDPVARASREEGIAFAAGTALSGLPLFGLLVRGRIRRRRAAERAAREDTAQPGRRRRGGRSRR